MTLAVYLRSVSCIRIKMGQMRCLSDGIRLLT